jgi:hypothetical protein
MVAIKTGFGVLSRLASGLVADKVGGLTTLIAGSFLQMLALIAYIPFDGLASLYVVSAIFGLSQGGKQLGLGPVVGRLGAGKAAAIHPIVDGPLKPLAPLVAGGFCGLALEI